MRPYGPEATDFDVDATEHLADPYPFLRVLRAERPVFWSEHLNAWVLTRYADVRAALADPETFSSEGSLVATQLSQEATELLGEHAGLSHFPANIDPPAHTRLRRAVASTFTPRAVEGLRTLIQKEALQLVDDLDEVRHAEFMSAFAQALSVRVTSRFVGIPAEDASMVKQWVEQWFELFRSPATSHRQLELADGFHSYLGYINALIEERRRFPSDDFISQMTSRLADKSLAISRDELVEVIASILLGGNETVATLLGNTMYRLHATPGLWARVVDDVALVPSVIEETLRIDGATLGDYRTTRAPVTIHGLTIPAGERVITYRDSAHHDESVFEEPERFVVTRANTRQHMAFGHGMHHCIGAAFSRVETEEALRVLTTRLPSLRLAQDQETSYRPAILRRSLDRLLLVW